MKKIILTTVMFLTFGFISAQDGKFKLGAHVGLPLGDIKDSYSLNLGADVAYVWNVADKFSVGLATGYTIYLGKTETFDTGVGIIEIDWDDAGFIPVAATGQYSVTENLFLGADLGYAIYVGSDGNDGGFFYQPKFGYQTDKLEVFAGYKGISVDGGTFSSINLGFNYKF